MEHKNKDDLGLDKLFPFSMRDNCLPAHYDMGGLYHWHDCLEISFVRSGTGRYYFENRVYEVVPGDIIIINNLEPHYLEVDDVVMHQPVIVFEPSLVAENGSRGSDFDYLSPFFERGADFSNKLDRDNPTYLEIMSNILEIEHEYACKSEGYQLMIKARLMVLLTLLIRNCRDTLQINARRKMQVLRIDRALKFINSNLSQDITLKEVADIMHITPQYFSAIFKGVVGVTFTEYILRARVNKAIPLLKESADTITEIAFECGFNNTVNFNVAFKKITGRTPSSYR